MPDLSYENFLRCVSDPVTQVRDLDGRLLGCIPRVPEDHNLPYVSSTSGQNFELRISAQVCVVVDRKTHNPSSLPGFIALDMKNADLGDPLPPLREGEVPPGEDPDIGQAI